MLLHVYAEHRAVRYCPLNANAGHPLDKSSHCTKNIKDQLSLPPQNRFLKIKINSSTEETDEHAAGGNTCVLILAQIICRREWDNDAESEGKGKELLWPKQRPCVGGRLSVWHGQFKWHGQFSYSFSHTAKVDTLHRIRLLSSKLFYNSR